MIIPIVSEVDWLTRLNRLPHWQPPLRRTVIISPHPDDETLGAGGLISYLTSLGVSVTVIAVTDGENAYADFSGLGPIREREQAAALETLGVANTHIQRLHIEDSNVAGNQAQLVEHLLSLVPAGATLVAPWGGDFHPDHEACGRAAQVVADQVGASLVSYFFWSWHRGELEIFDGLSAALFPLTPEQQSLKKTALLCHQSQLEHASGSPILPQNLLGPLERPFEVFLPS